MEISSIIVMIFILTFLWGGFLFLIILANKKEKKRTMNFQDSL